MRKPLILLVLVLLFLVPLASPAFAQNLVYNGVQIKGTYRQNEHLDITVTVINNDNNSRTFTITSFNITIVRSKQTQPIRAIFKIQLNMSKELQVNEGYTFYYSIDLKNFPPDKYNLTVYFTGSFEGEGPNDYYVYKDVQFQLLPSIEIPFVVYIVIAIMASIIAIYVGYGIAARIRG